VIMEAIWVCILLNYVDNDLSSCCRGLNLNLDPKFIEVLRGYDKKFLPRIM
jgi:hypothetical protein